MELSFLTLYLHFSHYSLLPSTPLTQAQKNEAIPHFMKTSLMDEWPQKVNPVLYTITLFLQGLIYLVRNTTGCVVER